MGNTRKDFEKYLIEKAWKDPVFHRQLQEKPKETIENELRQFDPAFVFPENMDVEIVEENPNRLCFVIPQNPMEFSGSELTEAQLEATAGGGIGIKVFGTAVVFLGVAVAALGLSNVVALANGVATANATATTNVTSGGPTSSSATNAGCGCGA